MFQEHKIVRAKKPYYGNISLFDIPWFELCLSKGEDILNKMEIMHTRDDDGLCTSFMCD